MSSSIRVAVKHMRHACPLIQDVNYHPALQDPHPVHAAHPALDSRATSPQLVHETHKIRATLLRRPRFRRGQSPASWNLHVQAVPSESLLAIQGRSKLSERHPLCAVRCSFPGCLSMAMDWTHEESSTRRVGAGACRSMQGVTGL